MSIQTVARGGTKLFERNTILNMSAIGADNNRFHDGCVSQSFPTLSPFQIRKLKIKIVNFVNGNVNFGNVN